METFRRLFLVALFAGSFSGLIVTLIHQISTVPLILKAEIYEKAADEKIIVSSTDNQSSANTLSFTKNNSTNHADHNETWEHERIFFTFLADLLTGIGFCLLLAVSYRIWGKSVHWRQGLYWGLAGFIIFTLAPGLGLPPEVPGTIAADLAARQIWWIVTVCFTAAGLGLIFLNKHMIYAIIGIALLTLPHIYGAPQPTEYISTAPEALTHRFIVVVIISGLIFWTSMGCLTSFFYNKFFKKDIFIDNYQQS
ncbi:MAG: CbtA family protein [Alphaproteobacteria bacterium]|nr:CbtA family protein [Alphaproteobacteria bacterium]